MSDETSIMLIEMTRQSLELLLTGGIFMALFVTFSVKLKKAHNVAGVVILAAVFTVLSMLYFHTHPDVLDSLLDNPTLTLLGVVISLTILVYRLVKK